MASLLLYHEKVVSQKDYRWDASRGVTKEGAKEWD